MTKDADFVKSRHAKDKKTFFAKRMIRVIKENCVLIIKDGLSLFEANPVLTNINLILLIIPFEYL